MRNLLSGRYHKKKPLSKQSTLAGTELTVVAEGGSRSEKSEAKNGFGSGIANGDSSSTILDHFCFHSSGMSGIIDSLDY